MTDARNPHPNASGYTPYQGTTNHSGIRHARENALSDRVFERLMSASYELKPDRDLEARFVLICLGRLGLRVGELAHLERDWLDRNRQRLSIPYHEPCNRGRDGGLCAQCRQNAEQRAEVNDELDLEAAHDLQWLAKTEAAVREIPYGWSPRAAYVVETYLDKYERWMYTSSTIERRIKWLVEYVPEAEGLYPHALRATAASYQAGRGLTIFALKQFMGWSQVDTARAYVEHNADKLDREINYLNR